MLQITILKNHDAESGSSNRVLYLCLLPELYALTFEVDEVFGRCCNLEKLLLQLLGAGVCVSKNHFQFVFFEKILSEYDAGAQMYAGHPLLSAVILFPIFHYVALSCVGRQKLQDF